MLPAEPPSVAEGCPGRSTYAHMPTVRARVYATGASIGAAAAGCSSAEPTSLALTLSRIGPNRRDQGRSDVMRAANAKP
jgi:hypothetical protein